LSLVERARADVQWLRDAMREGKVIYDIGLDAARPNRGFFYMVESGVMNVADYPNYIRITGLP
jgi:hypothetical protein